MAGPDAALLLTANSSQFQKLDIKEKANIQNAGLTGKKFSKPGNNSQLRQTGTIRDAAAMKTGGSNAWANSSGKMQPQQSLVSTKNQSGFKHSEGQGVTDNQFRMSQSMQKQPTTKE